ncbi:nli interacting factor-like phosphatase family protein [Stylonychia lemnae]|uniref:Mitochondrial import inner membrane translocase subunit TIM50 n=1 Tax=Stylonychia lemnae TaxID=5949 RepID=A0A078ABF9_STYLE|nr:nli interacting factor-like phosphatase family protein [Stylonychia lemnae]|eukprot:CDW79519.1 nli interacting factor-like phosphatase family protein [Stylonychia lemnae]
MNASPQVKQPRNLLTTKKTHSKEKNVSQVNKENPRLLKDIQHKLPNDVLEYISFCRDQQLSRNSTSGMSHTGMANSFIQQESSLSFNSGEKSSASSTASKQNRNKEAKQIKNQKQQQQPRQQSRNSKNTVNLLSRDSNPTFICQAPHKIEEQYTIRNEDSGLFDQSPVRSHVPQNLELDLVKLVNFKETDENQNRKMEDLTTPTLSKINTRQDSHLQFTNRTDASQSPSLQTFDDTQEARNSIIQTPLNLLQELMDHVAFYSQRNSERASNKQFELFPYSQYACEYDEDDEDQEDDSLPIATPPYLPPKNDDGKIYTLVLDLDETLIHFEDTLDNDEGDKEVFYMVRPGVNKFLTELSQYYEIVIFTAALQDYADWILNSIDRRDLSKTIIIDNIAENFEYTNEDNGLEIISWYDDLDDQELDKYIPFLIEMAIRQEPDVREIIKRYRDDFTAYVENRPSY